MVYRMDIYVDEYSCWKCDHVVEILLCKTQKAGEVQKTNKTVGF